MKKAKMVKFLLMAVVVMTCANYIPANAQTPVDISVDTSKPARETGLRRLKLDYSNTSITDEVANVATTLVDLGNDVQQADKIITLENSRGWVRLFVYQDRVRRIEYTVGEKNDPTKHLVQVYCPEENLDLWTSNHWCIQALKEVDSFITVGGYYGEDVYFDQPQALLVERALSGQTTLEDTELKHYIYGKEVDIAGYLQDNGVDVWKPSNGAGLLEIACEYYNCDLSTAIGAGGGELYVYPTFYERKVDIGPGEELPSWKLNFKRYSAVDKCYQLYGGNGDISISEDVLIAIMQLKQNNAVVLQYLHHRNTIYGATMPK